MRVVAPKVSTRCWATGPSRYFGLGAITSGSVTGSRRGPLTVTDARVASGNDHDKFCANASVMSAVCPGAGGAVTSTPNLLPGGMNSVSGLHVCQVGQPSSSITWKVAPGTSNFQ